MQLSVEADIRQAQRFAGAQGRRAVQQAAVRALNRTATQVQTHAGRALAQETGLRAGVAKQALARIKATRGMLVAAVTAKGRPINLIEFGARQTRRGVSANPWRKRRVFPGAFIVPRWNRVYKRKGTKRFPIVSMWGPSIPREFIRERVRTIMLTVAGEQWRKNFAADLRFYFSKIR